MSKLFKCKDCEKSISKKATVCPHCGRKYKKTSAFTKFVTFLFFLILFAYSISENTTNTKKSSYNKSENKNSNIVSNKRTLLKFDNLGWEYGLTSTRNTTPQELFVFKRSNFVLGYGLSLNCYPNQNKVELKIKDLSNDNNEKHLNEEITATFDNGEVYKFKSSNEMFPELDSTKTPTIYKNIINAMIKNNFVTFENNEGDYAKYNLSGFKSNSEYVVSCDKKEIESKLKALKE